MMQSRNDVFDEHFLKAHRLQGFLELPMNNENIKLHTEFCQSFKNALDVCIQVEPSEFKHMKKVG